ncbi:hypothetical protein RM578_07860 [Staphylococcus haemolyticus]|nr:hypothetical protein [Staphylococcus haemolyticus]MBE7355830.1 hypothetical protein [Staphylococcus haemolyticus]MBU6949175.1 hypothetical protein [Staphylococcus haemolyticus]MBU7212644.1 hypothetical protein [Staphylococcus haemolyticus]MCE5021757.1 hypothetical protein [Staphylococcus haemolyticus]MCH4483608.1 hypothetical protein [Staphylococcus haemolyticus]
MDKNKLETLLFYLVFMKAVGEVLKYSYQLKFEQLKTLYEIIKYFHVHQQGVYIDELITYQTISKRQLRHHLEHLYHLGWITKLRDDNDQRRILFLPSNRCQEKLNIMFMEVSEMVKGKNFDYLIETTAHYNQLGHVLTIFDALYKVRNIAKESNLSLDELFLLGKLLSSRQVISLKEIQAMSYRYLICMNVVINDLYQKGYLEKYRNSIDERIVNVKFIESRAYETNQLFIRCYNKFQEEMKYSKIS